MKTLQYLNTLIDTNLATESFITASEHREVEKAIVSSTVPINRGFINNFNVGSTGATSGGDIIGIAISTRVVLCTMNYTMPSTNYLVKAYIQSLGSDSTDSTIYNHSFNVVSTTQFKFIMAETGNATQNLKVHFEIISLD